MVLQLICLYMAIAVFYIVYFQRTFNVTKYLVVFTCISCGIGAFFAFLDVFGTYHRNRGVQPWPCPNVPDPRKFTPGFVGYYGSESLRTAVAVTACILTVVCIVMVRSTGKASDSKKNLVYQALAKKTILYPLVQSICRLPAIYIYVHDGIQAVDEPIHEEGLTGSEATSHLQTRLAGFYMYVIFTPMGGLLSLAVFFFVTPAARELCSKIFLCENPDVSPAREHELANVYPETRPTNVHEMDEDQLVDQVVILSQPAANGGGALVRASRPSLASELYAGNPVRANRPSLASEFYVDNPMATNLQRL